MRFFLLKTIDNPRAMRLTSQIMTIKPTTDHRLSAPTPFERKEFRPTRFGSPAVFKQVRLQREKFLNLDEPLLDDDKMSILQLIALISIPIGFGILIFQLF